MAGFALLSIYIVSPTESARVVKKLKPKIENQQKLRAPK
jgi:hypothetical protein